MKDSKGTCKRQHEEKIVLENLSGMPLDSYMVTFSVGKEECLNREFFYAFKKDFHAVMYVYFSWRNAPS